MLRIQIPKEEEEEEWVTCEGVGKTTIRQGAEGEGVAGHKQSPWQENVQGKLIRECPTDGRTEEQEGDHQG